MSSKLKKDSKVFKGPNQDLVTIAKLLNIKQDHTQTHKIYYCPICKKPTLKILSVKFFCSSEECILKYPKGLFASELVKLLPRNAPATVNN